jgi:hypothetical protein
MEKLTYEKIGNDTLLIDLHKNSYSVVARELYLYDEKKYQVTFYIKDNSTDILDLIEKEEKVEFDTDYKIINKAILKHVATLLSDGFYDYYMRRYDYMMKCFDKGHEIFEEARLAEMRLKNAG